MIPLFLDVVTPVVDDFMDILNDDGDGGDGDGDGFNIDDAADDTMDILFHSRWMGYIRNRIAIDDGGGGDIILEKNGNLFLSLGMSLVFTLVLVLLSAIFPLKMLLSSSLLLTLPFGWIGFL
jgi:hypothetical protein